MSNPKTNPVDIQVEQVESLAKVREILFGEQSKDYEVRLEGLEAKINREAGDIRNDLNVRLDAMETFIKKEMEAVLQQVKAEQSARVEAWKELTREHKEFSNLAEKKFSVLNEESQKGQKELRQHILDQSKTLSDEIQKRTDSLKKSLDQDSRELRGMKVDRGRLAELLMKVAVDLKGELKEPSAK